MKTKFGAYLQEWLQIKRGQVSAQTWDTYCQIVRDYIEPALGSIRMREITPHRIQLFYNQKLNEGVGARTVQKIHLLMNAVFKSAVQSGITGRNPLDVVKTPKATSTEMKFLDENQVKKLLQTAKETDAWNYALLYLALVTGMRHGELLALKWEDVDFDRGTLAVKFSLKRIRGGGLVRKQPKTKASIRTIKLGAQTVEVLQGQKERLRTQQASVGDLWEETDHVFPSSVGTPRDPSNVIKEFRQILKKASLPKIRFHDLRHTAASLMLNNGVEVLAVSQRLGHAKPSITLDVYGHLMPSLQKEVAERMDSLVTG